MSAIVRHAASVIVLACAVEGCGLVDPTNEDRLAQAAVTKYPDVFVSVETRRANFLDRATVDLRVARGADKQRIHEVLCTELPALANQLGVTADIAVGAYDEDGTQIDGASSRGCGE